jgi:chromosome segregation ATPase
MNKFIILALLFTLGACAFKRAPAHYTDTKTVLAEIDKDHYGSTFLSLVALNMASKSPIEEVTLLFDEIVANLENSQAKADEKNSTDQATCDETLGGFRKQISEQEDTIASLGNAIRENTEIVQQASIDLE